MVHNDWPRPTEIRDLPTQRHDGQTKRSFWRKLIRLPLWLLLLLVIPAAIVSYYVSESLYPDFKYTESKAEFESADLLSFLRSELVEIDFSSLPDGTSTKFWQIVDDAYQSQGVTFSCQATQSANIGSKANTKTTITAPHIVITVYEFRLPDAQQQTVAPSYHVKTEDYSTTAIPSMDSNHKKLFLGKTTIRFHEPGDPNSEAEIHRVGFYAGRLNMPETLRVQLFDTKGNLIGQQLNVSEPFVFMGFTTKRSIGRIEIEGVGDDKDYAIGNLIFENPK